MYHKTKLAQDEIEELMLFSYTFRPPQTVHPFQAYIQSRPKK